MNTISSYISFNGRCREAMTFYKECLGGELELLEVAGSPMEQYWPEGKDKIYHSSLAINGLLIMGSDMTGPDGYVKGNDISLAIGCSSEEEINTLFARLGEGGKVFDALKEAFWGDIFGALEDKYGTRWMFNYAKKQK